MGENCDKVLSSKWRNSMIRMVVVGMGKMGLVHFGIMNSLPGSEVVAFAEPQETIRSFMRKARSQNQLVC